MSTDLSAYPHGRVPRALREEQVLDLAEQLFAERGYQGASMDELAARAGVSKPVVYDLVGSKEGLYRACVERTAAALAEATAGAVAGEGTPGGQLRAGSLAFFEFVAQRRRTWQVLAASPALFAGDVAAMRERQAALVTRMLAEGAGRLGAEPDPRRVQALAHALNGAYEAMAYWWADNSEVEPAELAEWVVALLLPGLQQMAADSPPAA